jgi:hypothetical protein
MKGTRLCPSPVCNDAVIQRNNKYVVGSRFRGSPDVLLQQASNNVDVQSKILRYSQSSTSSLMNALGGVRGYETNAAVRRASSGVRFRSICLNRWAGGQDC